MAELSKHELFFPKKNGELIIVGSGDPSNISTFRKITGFQGQIVTDPTTQSFSLLGFSSGINKLFGLKTWKKGLSAIMHGVKPGMIQGNALQMGGAVIISPSNTILYHYISSEAGDDPPVEEMLAAIGNSVS